MRCDSTLFCRHLKQGEGIPLVFLHGFMGSSQDWQQVVDRLGTRSCLAYDLPGHGNTPWSDRQIIDLLAKTLPPTSHLVGYSLGGRLALQFAARDPARIASLTLLSAHCGLKTEQEKIKRLEHDRSWCLRFQREPFGKIVEEWYAQDVFMSLRANPMLLRSLISIRKNQNPNSLSKALEIWSLGHQKCYRDFLSNFSSTRILYGSLDQKFASLYADWPNAIKISAAGHCLHLEAPTAIAEVLNKIEESSI